MSKTHFSPQELQLHTHTCTHTYVWTRYRHTHTHTHTDTHMENYITTLPTVWLVIFEGLNILV